MEIALMENHQRLAQRLESADNISVEFQPGAATCPYQFKVRDYSSQGIGILVKKDSCVLDMIRVGDILDMKYYQGADRPIPVNVRTRIQHISSPENGRHENHFIVGLNIMKKDGVAENSFFSFDSIS